MKTKKLLFSLLFTFCLIWSVGLSVRSDARAEETGTAKSSVQTRIFLNPLYKDVLDESIFRQKEAADSSPVPRTTYETDKNVLVSALRRAMENRQQTLTLYYQCSSELSFEEFDSWITEAKKETGVCTQGDYLLYHVCGGSMRMFYSFENGTYYYTLTAGFIYSTTAEQEKAVTAKVKEVLNSLGISAMENDYQKIKAIYDYVCSHVTYDYTHLEDNSYLLKYSAYAALINGTSVCQGYASLLYRLLQESGIDCRVVSGIGAGGPHGWNIVKLGNSYYNVDSTWDAGAGSYSCFLKCNANFPDHERSPEYNTADFNREHPMAASDYVGKISTLTRDSLIYTITEERTATVTGYTGSPVDVVIPASVDSIPVTAISGSAFYNCQSLRSVSLPASLRKIEDGSCEGESSSSAFGYCKKLTTVTVPSGAQLSYIGSGAFVGCSALTGITLPDGLDTIGSQAFAFCPGLTEITIPASVTEISADAFEDASGSLVIHGETGSAAEAFAENSNLSFQDPNLEIPLSKCTFSTIPDQYYTGKALKPELTITYNGKTLEKDTDYTLTWENNVRPGTAAAVVTGKGIYTGSVRKSFKIKKYTTPPKGTQIKDSASGAYYKIKTAGTSAKATVEYVKPVNAKKTSVKIPATIVVNHVTCKVTSVAANAFKNNKYLKSVSIGSNVTSIGKNAFYGCKKLTKAVIGNKVTAIGSSAFSGCSRLSTLTIGSRVAAISSSAFYKCTALKKVTLPASLKKIGSKAFYGCKNLKTITIKSKNLTSKTVGSKAFTGTYSKASVKVPSGKGNAYKKLLISRGISSKAKFTK
ncbi:MAG: leucine-rich repeat protein [Candidatus Limivivens sp.]|nr:leucine-rich repeat protein [Candidatus Limivivens sp.]